MIEDLAKLKEAKNLVSIRRENIDSQRIQGLLVDFSNDLVLIHYVFDFIFDGQMILRRSDLSEIKSDKTDLLQTQLLKDDGIYSSFEFELNMDLTSWQTVFSTLNSQCRFVTLEDENSNDPSFYLGEVKNVGSKSVSILEFSGAANWRDENSAINYEDISCLQLNTNYAITYERYFDRKQAETS